MVEGRQTLSEGVKSRRAGSEERRRAPHLKPIPRTMLQSQAGASDSASTTGILQPAAPPPPAGNMREPPLSTAAYSGSEPSSDEEDELVAPPAPVDRRGLKRRVSDMEAAAGLARVSGSGHDPSLDCGPGLAAAGGGGVYGVAAVAGGAAAAAGLKPGKKTRGRVKIKMEFIDNKLRRYTTFSKRKTGIMKKVRQRASERLSRSRSRSRAASDSYSPGGPKRAE